MNARELVTQRIIDVVRTRPAAMVSLADLGIGPRYLYWTLESACRDLGINLDRVVSRLMPALAPA